MVEFTLLLPILFGLSLGVIELGRVLQHHHAVNKSVRDAARYLARVPAVCPSGPGVGSVESSADATTAVNLAMTGVASGGSSTLSYWTDPATVSPSVSCLDNSGGAFRGAAALPVVEVTAAVSYEPLGFLGFLGLPPITLTASHQELVIGE
jgi:predicted ribosomally synthesized peptide with SipW-like signal peptide